MKIAYCPRCKTTTNQFVTEGVIAKVVTCERCGTVISHQWKEAKDTKKGNKP